VNTLPLYHGGEHHRHLQSWALSVLLHGAAVGAAITLVSDLHLEPQPEPFRWDVSVLETPATEQVDKPRQSPVEPTPMVAQQVEPQPVTKSVQQVIRQEVREEVREITPVVQTRVQTTQAVDRQVQAVETPRQVIPLETAEPAPTSDAPPVVREDEAPAMPSVSAAAASDSTPQPTVVARPAVEAARPAVHELPVRPIPATKVDYGWLAEALWSRVERLKRYPHMARLNRWEGRVVLRVVIREDGHLLDLTVAESSGHAVLDQDALAILKLASPLTLKHPLGKPQVVVQVPISYKLQ
jgi:periplasmic protein TonB